MVNLNKYNHEKFVNREQHLAIIQEKLREIFSSSPPEKGELINFWGMGGLGKTFLKQQIKTIYDDNQSDQSNYVIIDWNGDVFLNKTYSIPEILIYFRNEFARYGFKMNEFTKYITYYRRCTSASLPDIIDENEESVTKSVFKGIFDFISHSVGLNTAIDGVIDIAQISKKKKKDKELKKGYEDFSNLDVGSMLSVLLEAFIEDIHHEIKGRKLIFLIDTFEDVRSINMDVLFSHKTEFKHVPGLFYALPPSLWIVLGREKTHLNDNQTTFQLKNFNTQETMKYMKENLSMIPDDKANQVISFSNGFPILLSELHHELLSTRGNITNEFLNQLIDEGKAENIIKNRYKKYFSESFNKQENIYLLKILFAFRKWTIYKEDISNSDVYQFMKEYHRNILQTIDLESKLQQLLQLSFINELSNTKYSTTYAIDQSIYTALFEQTIDDVPVISNELKKDVIAFLLQKLNKQNKEVVEITANVRIDENQAEVTQMIELLSSLYKQDNPVSLYKKVMQLLKHNHIDESTTAFIQVILLERFSTDYLSTQSGQQMITHILTYFQSFGIVEHIDRFVYLLDGIDNSQLLNEKLGHYFLSIGRLSYAKLFLIKATPSWNTFKSAMCYVTLADNDVYQDPASRSIGVHPDKLIEGLELQDESEYTTPYEKELYLYRKFLYNTRQLIRIQIELGDNSRLIHLIRAWDIAINLDKSNEDENISHSIWLHIDATILQGAVWYPPLLEELENFFIPKLNRSKYFAIEHPSFIVSLFKLTNSLFEFGYYQLQEKLYKLIVDVMQLVTDSKVQNQYNLRAFFKVLESSSYRRCKLQREMNIYPTLVKDSENESAEIKQRLLNYYETRVAENWRLPLELGALIETGMFDIKVMKFLNLNDNFLMLLNSVIDKLEMMDKESFHLADFYYQKGLYLLENKALPKSYPCFHNARSIIFNSLGKMVDTSKIFIPYETFNLFTRFHLLKDNSMPMTKDEFKIFKEQAESNQTMIMNSYEDNLPNAMELYLFSVEIIEGIESIVHEEKYQVNVKEASALLATVTDQQVYCAVQKLGRHLFLDVIEKYNKEHLFIKQKFTTIPLGQKTANVVENAEYDWDNHKMPDKNYEVYYKMANDDLSYLINNSNDFNMFFNRYFTRLQHCFKFYNNYTNQIGTTFEKITNTIIDIQSANNRQRNKILETLIRSLKYN